MKIKRILITALPFLISLLLFVMVGNFGFAKINEIRSNIKTSEKVQILLTQKLNILQTLSQIAHNDTDAVNAALPNSNSVIAVISQLKLLANQNGLMLLALNSSNVLAADTSVRENDISFKLIGPKSQMISFLKNISQIAPITVVDRVDITQVGLDVEAKVGVKTFWADYPKSIPSLTQPINDLTESDQSTLAKILSLSRVTSSEVASPSSSTTVNTNNTNPFGE